LTWTTRAACVVALQSIFMQKKNNPLGLLAHAAIQSRHTIEKQSLVQTLLKNICLTEPHRLSVLFKYTGRSLGESYTDAQYHVADMRQYLQTADKNKNKTAKKTQKISQKLDFAHPDLLKLKLSTDPYHSHYKTQTSESLHHSSNNLNTQSSSSLGNSFKTKPSKLVNANYTCFKTDSVPIHDEIAKPIAGTANRHKLSFMRPNSSHAKKDFLNKKKNSVEIKGKISNFCKVSCQLFKII
jgi:hypothetical protein